MYGSAIGSWAFAFCVIENSSANAAQSKNLSFVMVVVFKLVSCKCINLNNKRQQAVRLVCIKNCLFFDCRTFCSFTIWRILHKSVN